MIRIDLNCDLGEGCANDAALMPLVSSVNIACGGHAGDERTMRSCVEQAAALGVNVGAHPAYPDRAHFGRREMLLDRDVLISTIIDQVCALRSVCRQMNVPLRHVKPHGALYNQSARDAAIADVVAEAAWRVDPRLILVGLAGSESLAAARRRGLAAAAEGFADRMYQPDGSLTPRSHANALIHSPAAAAAQALRLARDGEVIAADGTPLRINVQTICLHGDSPNALAVAVAVRDAIQRDER